MAMRKVVDWDAKTAYAKRLTEEELEHAIRDCIATAELWERGEDADADAEGNAGYYRTEANVYRTELNGRAGEFTVTLTVVTPQDATRTLRETGTPAPTFRNRNAAERFADQVSSALLVFNPSVRVSAHIYRNGTRVHTVAL